MRLMAGNGCMELANNIARRMRTRLIKCNVGKFSDGETAVEIYEHIRGETIFIIQSTCKPVNDNLMELLIMADAVKRSGASRIVAVIPYYGYARQDRRPKRSRTPISSRLVADLIKKAGFHEVVTVDIHSKQQQGFFTIPVTDISATPNIEADIWSHYKECVIVSPDAGGVERVRSVARHLDLDMAIIDKRRPKANVSEVMNVLGDVDGRDCVIFDDMVDTAGTLCKAAEALKERGAQRIAAYCTHPVLSGVAFSNLSKSVLDKLIVCDTISHIPHEKVRVISITDLLAETIRRIDTNQSVAEIYVDY